MPMESKDHRSRVAAERRQRMKSRLLHSTMELVATTGVSAPSIDEVIGAAGVSRGTFYKYFSSPHALVQELAVEVARDLVDLADPLVRQRDDPAERVACGIRVVCRLALHHPSAAAFLVQMGWPDTQESNLLLDFVRRDIEEGMRRGTFTTMPVSLALNMVSGAVIGAIHCMLRPGCEENYAALTAAATLRALGVSSGEADLVANKPLEPIEAFPERLLAATAPTGNVTARDEVGSPGRTQGKRVSKKRAPVS